MLKAQSLSACHSGLSSVTGVSLGSETLRCLKTSAGYRERGRQSIVCAPGVLSKGNIIKGTMSEHKKKKKELVGYFYSIAKTLKILFKQCCLLGCVFSVLNCFSAVVFLVQGKRSGFCGIFFFFFD